MTTTVTTLAISFTDNPPAVMMMAGGAILILLLLLANVRRRMRRNRPAPVDPREKIEQTRQANGMSNDLRQMMVELEDLTRRFGAQLDAKSTKLERLLEDAEAKIAQLRATVNGAAEDETAATPSLGRELGADRQGTKAKKGPTRVPSIEVPAKAMPEEIDPMTRRIYDLADKGRGPVDIARELGEHVGKVELILALRQQSV